ncbi:MAG: TonB-dependent receptor [Candidatus Brocadiia bacterium]
MKSVIVAAAIMALMVASSANAYAEQVSIENVDITGIDRSRIDLVAPGKLAEFPLEKEIVFERGVSLRKPLLGPITLWGRVGVGNRNSYSGDLLGGFEGDEYIADLQGAVNTFDGRRDGENYETLDASSSISRRFASGLVIRLATHFASYRYDILGPEDISALSTRDVNGNSVSVDFDLPIGPGAQLVIGGFLSKYEVSRAGNSQSERKLGLQGVLKGDVYTVRLSTWLYSFSSGEDELYANFEARDDLLLRSGNFSVGWIFGLDLSAGRSLSLTPRLTANWRLDPRFSFFALIGVDTRLPSLEDDVASLPEVDPFAAPPSPTRSFITDLGVKFAPTSFSKITVTLEYRNEKSSVFYERDTTGYLVLMQMGDADFFILKAEGEVYFSTRIRLYGNVRFGYAYPGGSFDRFPYFPHSRSLVGAAFDVTSRLKLSTEMEFRGSVFANTAGSVTLPDYALFHFEMTYTIGEYVVVFVRGSNVFNQRHYIYDGWRGYPRMVLAGVEIRF